MKQKKVRERPVIFSGPMVRAIIDGRKTQTRRIVPVPEVEFFDGYTPNGDVYWSTRTQPTGTNVIRNRYGVPGGRLWVRETFGNFWGGWKYRATDDREGLAKSNWKSPAHMPRTACRIYLEIINIRVERLQAMSKDDALAEGVTDTTGTWEGMKDGSGGPREAFSMLWDSINGRSASWNSNPWVWVVMFRRI